MTIVSAASAAAEAWRRSVGLLGQDPGGGQLVLDVLQGLQHRLAVLGDRLVVGGLGLVHPRAARAGVEQGLGDRGAVAPQRVGAGEQASPARWTAKP